MNRKIKLSVALAAALALAGGVAQARDTRFQRDAYRHVRGPARTSVIVVESGCMNAEDSAATLHMNQNSGGWKVRADGSVIARYHC